MRNFEYIDVFIIRTPGSDRAIPLLDVLNKSKILRTQIIDATMYSRQSHKDEIDWRGQLAVYGSELPDGLIGCAMSHQNAFERVVDLGKGAIILEDDARIPSLEEFESLATHFLLDHSSGRYVLSLLPWNHKDGCLEKSVSNEGLFTLRGNTPLTVGYVLTLDAAKELSASNPKFKYAPDWPPSSVVYLSSLVGVINHGDQQSGSVIQHLRRERGLNRLRKLLRILFLDFWRFRREFQSPSEYLRLKIGPSLTWRLDDKRAKRALRKLKA
jgi:hypothetical protein